MRQQSPTRGSRSTTVANVNVSGGQATTSWRVPRNWPRGTTTVVATFTPNTGSAYTAGAMRLTLRIR
ncbi:MAG: hypothetical protein ACKN9D_10940 [Actinomycetales bacterium]